MKKILFLCGLLIGELLNTSSSLAQIECRNEVKKAKNKNYSVTYDYYCKNGKYIVKCGEHASYLAGCQGKKDREIVFDDKNSFLNRITKAGEFSKVYQKDGINPEMPIEYVLGNTVAKDPEHTKNVAKFAQEFEENTVVLIDGKEVKQPLHMYSIAVETAKQDKSDRVFAEDPVKDASDTTSKTIVDTSAGNSFADTAISTNTQNIAKSSTEVVETPLPSSGEIKSDNSLSQSTEIKSLETENTVGAKAQSDASQKINDIEKADLSNQSVNAETQSEKNVEMETLDADKAYQDTNATEQTIGSTQSGYVSQVEDVAQGIDNDFGMGICKEGSIFKQLACRAGFIGNGLRKVAYIIAGFALIVFSFAAIFGKVKWPVFCTIMFCCFLLSVMVFVVNTMTDKKDSAAWIGGINDDGSVVSYQSTNAEMQIPPTDNGETNIPSSFSRPE